MGIYDIELGVDHAAKDTGRRIHMRVRERDPLSAGIRAEELADATLQSPVEYTHAMRVRPIMETTPTPAATMPLALAA